MFEIRKNLDLRKILVTPKIFLKSRVNCIEISLKCRHDLGIEKFPSYSILCGCCNLYNLLFLLKHILRYSHQNEILRCSHKCLTLCCNVCWQQYILHLQCIGQECLSRDGNLYKDEDNSFKLRCCLFKGRIAPLPHESNPYLPSSPGTNETRVH